MKYYLRVEGVNLANFVYDTQDLSTIRGGGLLLLNAIDMIQKEIKEKLKINLEPISTGASSGLFEFDANDGGIEVVKKIKEFLNNDNSLKHATFVVDTLKIDNNNDFVSNKEKMLTLNRWGQMQSPSAAFPTEISQKVCSIDFVRSAGNEKGPDGELISESVNQRRKYGKKGKHDFYKNQFDYYNSLNTTAKLSDKIINKGFVNDFDELSSDTNKGKIHHKLAVIYLDGNHFSGIQNSECQTKDLQKEFDTDVKKLRIKLLYDLFNEEINNKKNWINSEKENNYRIETLLWGGDEIVLVVPAWKGWEVLNFFYKKSENWTFKNNTLTHAAGLVFCHHNAPIHRIVKLAKDLAEKAKEKGKNTIKELKNKENDESKKKKIEKESRVENLFAYQVLESFDHITMDLDDFWKSRLKKAINIDASELILHSNILADYITAFPKIAKDVPRSKIYQNVHTLLRGDTVDNNSINIFKQLVDKTTDPDFKNIEEHPITWLHLAELWDYLPQEGH